MRIHSKSESCGSLWLLILSALFALSVSVLVAPLSAADNEADFVFESDVMVPMRDGTKLATNLYRPQGEGRVPAVLMRTPYGKPGKNFGMAKSVVESGYALVTQDCRGRGKSEGTWDPFAFDIPDGFDTQEWVGKQPWCDGRIGTAGGSYGGWTQWATAPNASRHLRCIVAVVPFSDVFHDIAYTGGAFQLALMMGWGMGVGGVHLLPEPLQRAYRHLPLNTFGDQFEKSIPYLNDWVKHSLYDDYWKQRGIGRRYADVRVPTLNIGGWYDIFSKATLEQTAGVRGTSKEHLVRRNQCVVMGPWAHGVGARKVGELDFGEAARRNVAELQIQWLNYWLRDQDTGVERWPAYHIFVMGENRWRAEAEWPLERTRYTSVYLHSGGNANSANGDGALAMEKPKDEPPDRFVYDPDDPVPTTGGNNLVGAKLGPVDQREVEARNDVLVYTSAPLEEAMEVTGPVRMVLYAASSATDTDFTAKLVDVHTDGRAFNLCDGIIRGRFRNGMDSPGLLTPGAVERFEIDLWVTSNVLKPGHRIRVEVSSSNFPRFDRNPNSGKPFGTDTTVQAAKQTVYHDGERASHLVLPVIPR